MVGVHVALYAKYKKGNFTAVNDDMWPMNMISQSLTGINYVSVDNVENLTIEAGDSSKFQYDPPAELDENILSVTRKADTLFVVGKSTKNKIGRWYRRANLSISGLLPVHVKNSQIRLNRSKNTQPLSLDISLDEAFMEVNTDTQETLNFSTLKLNAVRGSRINFFNAKINSLDISLQNSFLEETTLNADSITINTDPSSKIQLSGKNLQKAKITSHE
jgi:hypothetical protein